MARLEQQNFRQLPSTIRTITGRDATPSPSLAETNPIDDSESMLTVREPVNESQNARNSDAICTFEYPFDQDLKSSRPYTQAMKNHRVWSTASSEIHTMGWSYLSGLSLAEVSHISVINLAFCPQDLWNGHHYPATSVDRDGFVSCKNSNSSSPNAAQAVPTFRRDPRTIIILGKFSPRAVNAPCSSIAVLNCCGFFRWSLFGQDDYIQPPTITFWERYHRTRTLSGF